MPRLVAGRGHRLRCHDRNTTKAKERVPPNKLIPMAVAAGGRRAKTSRESPCTAVQARADNGHCCRGKVQQQATQHLFIIITCSLYRPITSRPAPERPACWPCCPVGCEDAPACVCDLLEQ